MAFTRPIKYHGGKEYLAKRIIELMPKHTHYVEPFFGGGAVLFAKECEGVSEVVNDLNYRLTNFWCCLKHDAMFQQFMRVIECTPFSQWEFGRGAKENNELVRKIGEMIGESERDAWNVSEGVRFFIQYRQSRQGLGKDFATLSRNRTRRGMNEQVSSWLSAIEGLPEAHERLKRVVILNDDANRVIEQQDGVNTFFYCDPPYLHETRVTKGDYECEMTVEQHETLLETLSSVCGRFILSGYPSPLYEQWERSEGFKRVDIEIDNKASSKKTKEVKTECLWMNF